MAGSLFWPSLSGLTCLLCIWLAVYLPSVTKRLIHEGVKKAVIWRPDSSPEVDARYRSNAGPGSIPDYVSIWLFNITNVEEIRKGEKPLLEEVGPFVYHKVLTKVDVMWAADGSLSAKDYVYYDLVPELTKVDLAVNITTLNMALLGVLEAANHAVSGPVYEGIIDFLVALLAGWGDPKFNGLFQERSAHELIWGYEDALLKRLAGLLPPHTIPTTRVELMHNMTSVEEASAGPLTVYNTGVNDLNSLWKILSFEDGLTEVSCWNNCTEKVRGTDGTQFTPGVKRSDDLQVWAPPLLRTSTFTYSKDVELFGVRLYRFTQRAEDFAVDDCHYQSIQGIMNLTIPRAVGAHGTPGGATGPPVYISKPHFCDCDPSLSDAVLGMNCQPDLHTMFLDVEPITGASMRAHLRVMLSSEMTPTVRRHLEPRMDKVTTGRTLFPIFWMDEYCYAPEKGVAAFKGVVYRLMAASKLIWIGSIICAIILVSVTMLLMHNHQYVDAEEDVEVAQPQPRATVPAPATPTPVETDLKAPLLDHSS